MTTEALEGVVLTLTPIYGGFHVKHVAPDVCVHVEAMLVNWRIRRYHGPCESIHSHLGPYWCYAGRSREVFLRAVAEAIAWDGDENNPPNGWVKSYTGEYRAEYGR